MDLRKVLIQSRNATDIEKPLTKITSNILEYFCFQEVLINEFRAEDENSRHRLTRKQIKLPAQHVERLWENIYKHNVKAEPLSAILAFYLHHRVYPPPVQRAFDSLIIAFTAAKVPRKLRTLLFQTVEEMCHWLSPSCITDTVKLSMSPSVVAGLLPCCLINKDIPPPAHSVYEWLISSLTSPGLCLEDRARVLGFLMATLPADLTPTLNKQLITWLSYCRTPQTTAGLFRSADVTELDGSPALGVSTALTLVSNITELHYLSLVAFSGIRRYLWRSRECASTALTCAVCGYCSALLAQAAKRPTQPQDKLVVAAVLEEVVLVLAAVKQVDPSSAGKCQLMVGTVQHLAEQLRITSLLVSVWEYQITQGGESNLTDRILGNIIKSEFSQGPLSHKMAVVLAGLGHEPRLARHMARHSPNLLKLVATHPSTLVEEFMDIVIHLSSDLELITEMLHGLLDLPALSASICVHQSSLLVQAGFKVPVLLSVKQPVVVEPNLNSVFVTQVLHGLLDLPALSASICIHQSSLLVQAGFKVPVLLSVRQQVEVEPNLNSVFVHMMRKEAKPGETSNLLALYPDYWALLRPLLSLGLVDVCSQVTPLLLQVFLEAVHKNVEANKLILPALLSRVPLLCPIPVYQKSVYDVFYQYVSKVSSLQPDVMEHPSVTQFLSVTSYCHICPLLFESVVTAVGEHVKTEQTVGECFDVLEAVLREYLLDKTVTREFLLEKTIKDLKLETSVCRSLAKLASRNTSLIPRAINAFDKLIEKQESSAGEEKEMFMQHTKELIRILKNPRLASVVLTPSCKEDQAMATLVKVLFQFLD